MNLKLRTTIALMWTSVSLFYCTARAATVTIDWTTFPDGSPIPYGTAITNQFQSLGVVFGSAPGPPIVQDDLGGILISGGPTGFFGDTRMFFADVGLGLPSALTVEIIGSGLNCAARLQAFDSNNNLLGDVTHTNTGSTGTLSPFTFVAPGGKTISSAIYNGGLNPNAAASIGTLLIISTPHVPLQVSLQLYAGLSIAGSVGTVYSIEYVTDLAQTNTPSAWRCLEYLQLPASPYLWADKSAPATGKRFYRAGVFPAPTNMVFIPPGTFRMGSPTNEVDRYVGEDPQMAVTISRGYWLGKYEVTQAEYLAVMGTNPSWFNGVRTNVWDPSCGCETNKDYGGDLSRPVETVSLDDATAYCAALTERERLAERIATNSVYRLPTEAEWEYACRAETSDRRFSYGDDPGYTNLTNYAWYFENSGRETHPVGQKLANPWGLYDMHGNVWEWCQDWYDTYPGGIAIDPEGPATGIFRVVRGGDWVTRRDFCRSATRLNVGQAYRNNTTGFRVVLAPGQP